MNEPTITSGNVIVKDGKIQFDNYLTMLEQSKKIAEYLGAITVTKDTIKANKKIIAKAREAVNDLENRRIAIKKELLEPYNEFEAKIKNITGIINEADETVRDQIREFEEQERDAKREELEKVWNAKANQFPGTESVISFNDFVENRHLNKSVTIKKTTEEMVNKLKQISDDIDVLEGYEPDCLLEYKSNGYRLAPAITTVKNRKESIQKYKAQKEEKKQEQEGKKLFTLGLFKQEDMDQVVIFCQTNGIKFKEIK